MHLYHQRHSDISKYECTHVQLLLSIENNFELIMPEMKYCTDNAAMIGAAAYQLYLKGRFSDVDLNAKASDKLN